MPQRHASDREVAHPLVPLLLRCLKPGERVLILGAGSGRNLPPFLDGGLVVATVEPDERRRAALAARFPEAIAGGSLRVAARLAELRTHGGPPYAALLSTHALLHGTPAQIAELLTEALAEVRPGAWIAATFGSRRDPRFGEGTRVDDATWAPASGSEAGVPHAYFTREQLCELLAALDVRDLVERSAGETAGMWAHTEREARTLRHWFLTAQRRADAPGQ